jgi:hypothetical protein
MIDLNAERARRAALLPEGASCEVCGEGDPIVLNSDERMILCAEHAAIRQNRSAVEEHHVASRRYSGVTIFVPLNLHRRLTVLQRIRARARQRKGKDEAAAA